MECVTRNSYWESNGKHSDGSKTKICDLGNTHLVNIIHHCNKHFCDEMNDPEVIQLLNVLNEEVAIRNIEHMMGKGFIPYVSKTTGELVTNGEV